MILVLMAVFGVYVKNQNAENIQAPASNSKWESTNAGSYSADTPITITLKGVDQNGISASSLDETKITVLIDGIEDTGVTKTVTANQVSGNYASYDVTLSGFTRVGNLSLQIAT